ncbi:hypothetical protein [Burkholderia cepacia]|uniref:hypothetical protein n=1 Tax=Burkholderia cepacia TaxID=292 RepID=UPI0012D95DA0|nr:hypothetical protein [Burkholderia cepacia]
MAAIILGGENAQYAEERRTITGIRAVGHAIPGRSQQRANLPREVARNAVESQLDPSVVTVNSKWMDGWWQVLAGTSWRREANPIGLIAFCVSLAESILENRLEPSSSSVQATDPAHSRISAAQMQKPPPFGRGFLA